jgi:hypothetical protein
MTYYIVCQIDVYENDTVNSYDILLETTSPRRWHEIAGARARTLKST